MIIDFIDNPLCWCMKNNVEVDEYVNNYSFNPNKPYELDLFLEKIFPQISNIKYIYEQAMEDISANGLIASHQSTQRPFLVKLSSLDLHRNKIRLSDTGKEFLNYIKFPE